MYLTENNILYEFQSGFRRKYSTDTCLLYLQDYIRKQISNGLYTGMVLLDIQKAFDSVNHSILCKKLSALGVKSTAWFESYLNCRSQIVSVNGSDSEPMALTCGEPQGSILGPILFLSYVNDMPNCFDCVLLQYSGDIALIVSDKDPIKIGQQLSKNLSSCNKWLVEKVNSRLKSLYRQARFLDQNLKKKLCSALVLCLFDYSISSWYCGINKTTSNKLQVAQNKVIRFILNQNIMYHIGEGDFKQLNFLDFQNRTKQLRLNHVFNIFNEIGPEYLRSNFTRVLNSHNHNTRKSVQNFIIPKKSTVISGSFYCNAIMNWSSLPNAIKSTSNKSVLKKSVRTHLMKEINC